MKILEKKWMSLTKKLSLNLFKYTVLIFFILSNPTYSEVKFIKSAVEEVVITDGDSIKIGIEKIRLFGIDAPEMKQICNDENNNPYACGHVSKKFLSDLLYIKSSGEQIYCYYSERDKYKRIIGDCYIGVDNKIGINFNMVFYGQAVAYTRYSEKYLDAQNSAKSFKFGIWAGKFEMPEEWRKINK